MNFRLLALSGYTNHILFSKNFITSVKKSSVYLDNKTELPVGENYKDRIEELASKRKFL